MTAIYTGRVLKAVISQIDRQAEEVVR